MRLGGFVMAGLLLSALPALADDAILSTPTGDLHGTSLTAGTGAPAVLILAGSGPTDRNGNAAALGLNTDMYKMLADGLAAQGISSLRVDKRGIAASALAMPAEKDLTIQTYVDDAKGWAAQLRARSGARCAWLLGHSEGALVAEIAATQEARGICGLVLVAGIGRDMATVLREQMHANPANPPALVKAADDIISQLKAGHTVAPVPPILAAAFRPSVQPYLISEIAIDPAALLAKIGLPVLIVQGETDIQVSVQDAKLLAAAKPDAKLVILPGINHILKVAPADRTANAATYADPTLPLAPGLVDTIAGFIKAHT